MNKYKVEIPKDLLIQADYLNTVSGGMSMSAAWANKDENGYTLTIKVPGVDVEALQVMVKDQRLMVFHHIPVLNGKNHLPYYIVNLPVLPEIDIDGIEASYVDGKLQIFGPLSNWAKGDVKEIDINY